MDKDKTPQENIDILDSIAFDLKEGIDDLISQIKKLKLDVDKMKNS